MLAGCMEFFFMCTCKHVCFCIVLFLEVNDCWLASPVGLSSVLGFLKASKWAFFCGIMELCTSMTKIYLCALSLAHFSNFLFTPFLILHILSSTSLSSFFKFFILLCYFLRGMEMLWALDFVFSPFPSPPPLFMCSHLAWSKDQGENFILCFIEDANYS